MGSVRTYDKHKDSVIEALRRTKFKFPGRQKIYISKKWGFTKWDREEYDDLRANVLCKLMVAMLNICLTMDLWPNGAKFKLNWLVCKPLLYVLAMNKKA